MKTQKTNNRGVALVIVVGMLALLLISAVAFSILMRVERSGASNFHHATSARQMLYTALARAIEEINTSVGTNAWPPWTDDVLSSSHPDGDYARLLSERALWFLPQSLRQAVETSVPIWTPIDVGGRTVGRYAYTIGNVSGLLDANVVFDPATNRWMGSSPAEIRLSSALIDVTDTNLFVADRGDDGHYVTLDELSSLNTGIDYLKLSSFEVFSYAPHELQPDGITPKIDISTLDKITTQKAEIIAAFTACGLKPGQANWAYLGLVDFADGDSIPEGADDSEKFGRPMTEAVPTLGQFLVQLDYQPEIFEDIPDPGMTTVILTVKYGCVLYLNYPFLGNTGQTDYQLEADLVLVDNNVGDAWDDIRIPVAEQTITLTTNITVQAGATTIAVEAFVIEKSIFFEVVSPVEDFPSFDLVGAVSELRIKDGADTVYRIPASATVGSPIESMMAYAGTAEAKLENFWAEAIDPRCTWDGLDPAMWCYSHNDIIGDTLFEIANRPAFSGYTPACNFQGVGSLTEFLLKTPAALANFKMNVDGVRDGAPAAFCDPKVIQNRAYVANRPLLSVGELGYLPIERWQTITLYDHEHDVRHTSVLPGAGNPQLPSHGYHKVLDYFTLHSADAGPRRGVVNVNTPNTNVLAAIFEDLPLRVEENLPNVRVHSAQHADASPAQKDDAMDLATLVKNNGPYTSLSDLGKIWKGVSQLGNFATLVGALPDNAEIRILAEPCSTATGLSDKFGEFEREAIIRNSCELLTTRQQIFTIFMRADAFSPKFGFTDIKQGNVLATAQAVAQVWRDPVATDVGGGVKKHKMFVRYFKMLEE